VNKSGKQRPKSLSLKSEGLHSNRILAIIPLNGQRVSVSLSLTFPKQCRAALNPDPGRSSVVLIRREVIRDHGSRRRVHNKGK
jgi:hypothetical protein